MSSYSRTVQWLVWGFLAVVIVSILIAYLGQRASTSKLPVFHQIQSFALTNQNGRTVTLDSLRGNVWIADVIFTRCAGTCLVLTREMREVQAAFPATARLRFISLTADPEFDSSEVLRKYGNHFQADPQRWFFLTGEKSDVYGLAIDQLKFTVVDNERDRKPGEELFLHSQKFVVVDATGHVRTYINGTEPNTVPELIRVTKALLKEGTR